MDYGLLYLMFRTSMFVILFKFTVNLYVTLEFIL